MLDAYLKGVQGASTNYFPTMISCQRDKLSWWRGGKGTKIAVSKQVPSTDCPIERCTEKRMVVGQEVHCRYRICVLRKSYKAKPRWHCPDLHCNNIKVKSITWRTDVSTSDSYMVIQVSFLVLQVRNLNNCWEFTVNSS